MNRSNLAPFGGIMEQRFFIIAPLAMNSAKKFRKNVF